MEDNVQPPQEQPPVPPIPWQEFLWFLSDPVKQQICMAAPQILRQQKTVMDKLSRLDHLAYTCTDQHYVCVVDNSDLDTPT